MENIVYRPEYNFMTYSFTLLAPYKLQTFHVLVVVATAWLRFLKWQSQWRLQSWIYVPVALHPRRPRALVLLTLGAPGGSSTTCSRHHAPLSRAHTCMQWYAPTAAAKNGKLRLLYEVAPVAFLFEQAGGRAICAPGRSPLDIVPTAAHERCPIYLGCARDVDALEACLAATA